VPSPVAVPEARRDADSVVERLPAPTRPPLLSEESIAAALRRGEAPALDALHAEYGRTVFAYLARTIGDHASAEDVHQQVFTELWERRDGFDPARGRLFTWVMTIARSRAIDHLRKRVPEPRDTSRDPVASETGDHAGPIERLVERWRVAYLLRRIPADEAAILRLRFYDDLTQREIAERTGVPLGTVKMRMIQALERLRTLIEQEAA
jgi:RNA polymerase sigma-70 factor (ECF subfamily)